MLDTTISPLINSTESKTREERRRTSMAMASLSTEVESRVPRSPEVAFRIGGGDNIVDIVDVHTMPSTVKSLRKLMSGFCDLQNQSAVVDIEDDDRYDLYLHEQEQPSSFQRPNNETVTTNGTTNAISRATLDPLFTNIASIDSSCGAPNTPLLVEDNEMTMTMTPLSMEDMSLTKRVLFPCNDDEKEQDGRKSTFRETAMANRLPDVDSEEECDYDNDSDNDNVVNYAVANNNSLQRQDQPRHNQRRPTHRRPNWNRVFFSMTVITVILCGVMVRLLENYRARDDFVAWIAKRCAIQQEEVTTHIASDADADADADATAVASDDTATTHKAVHEAASLPPKAKPKMEIEERNLETTWLDTLYDDAEDILRLTNDQTQIYLRQAVGEILLELGHQQNQLLETIYECQENIRRATSTNTQLFNITKCYSDLERIRNITVALELFMQRFSGNTTWGEMGIDLSIARRKEHHLAMELSASDYAKHHASYIQRTLELVLGKNNLEHVHKTWIDLTEHIRGMKNFDDENFNNKLVEIGNTIVRFYEESGLRLYVGRLETKLTDVIGQGNTAIIINESWVEITDSLSDYYKNNSLKDYLQSQTPPPSIIPMLDAELLIVESKDSIEGGVKDDDLVSETEESCSSSSSRNIHTEQTSRTTKESNLFFNNDLDEALVPGKDSEMSNEESTFNEKYEKEPLVDEQPSPPGLKIPTDQVNEERVADKNQADETNDDEIHEYDFSSGIATEEDGIVDKSQPFLEELYISSTSTSSSSSLPPLHISDIEDKSTTNFAGTMEEAIPLDGMSEPDKIPVKTPSDPSLSSRDNVMSTEVKDTELVESVEDDDAIDKYEIIDVDEEKDDTSIPTDEIIASVDKKYHLSVSSRQSNETDDVPAITISDVESSTQRDSADDEGKTNELVPKLQARRHWNSPRGWMPRQQRSIEILRPSLNSEAEEEE